MPYTLTAQDPEDGPIGDGKVMVQLERRNRLSDSDENNPHPGYALMRSGTCFACHTAADKSAGPPYLSVAHRHATNAVARETLAAKIITGGLGVWGQVPMPPNPNYTRDQTRQMVDWILSLANRQVLNLPAVLNGTFKPAATLGTGERDAEGVLVLTAAATDQAKGAIPALRGETSLTLRTRRQRAAHFDAAQGVSSQENLGDGLVVRLDAGSWIRFDRIDLAQVQELRWRGRSLTEIPATLEARLDKVDGELWARVELPADGRSGPSNVRSPVQSATGVRSIFFLPKFKDNSVENRVELTTIEFRADP